MNVMKADENENPAISLFLDFVADDIKSCPQAILPMSAELAAQIAMLTDGMEVDPDLPIAGEVSV